MNITNFSLCTFFLIIYFINCQTYSVGASSNSILPTINNRTDYWKVLDSNDPSPGTFIEKFDVGNIIVGNGNGYCHWVRDDVRVSVTAIKFGEDTLVTMSANLYMLFKDDLELYYNMVKVRVGKKFGNLKFIGHATHNHEAPDSAAIDPRYPINRAYFKYLLDTFTKTTINALEAMKPAVIRFVENDWAHALRDSRDPRLFDKKLRILQAKSIQDGKVISTIVNWNVHPEVTLGFRTVTPDEDCRRLGKEPGCPSRGQYFSGDFVQTLEDLLKKEVGGEVTYISGSLGLLITPWGDCWEVTPEHPITGDGSKMPEGAVSLPRNFRRQLIIGRELTNAVVRFLKDSTVLRPAPFTYKSIEFYTRVTNTKFRAGLALLRTNNQPVIGYSKRMLYTCTNHTHPADHNCKGDNYEHTITPPIRVGEYGKSEVVSVNFGSGLKWLTCPGEIPPEVFTGLPSDFIANPPKYYNNPGHHAVGEAYKLPFPPLRAALNCRSCWLLGLSMDEGGYLVPLSDYRVFCMLGELICSKLPLQYKDSFSGEFCQFIVRNEAEARRIHGNLVYTLSERVCRYGTINKALHHYEETNGLGWNFLNDYHRAAILAMN